MNCKMHRGFVALISTLLLSGILLLLGAVIGLFSYLAHEAATDEQSYRGAQQAAFSCARFALSRLDADPLRFAGIGTTSIQLSDTSGCAIVEASSTHDSAGALTEGESGLSSVRIFFTAARASTTAPFQLRTWTEY